MPHVTKSRIKTFESCPLLFKWQYIDHKVPDIPPAAVTTIGLDVHNIFNRFYDHIKLEEIPTENPKEYFFMAMSVPPQYVGIYNQFCNFQTRRWNITKNKDEFLPLFKEKKFINNDEVGIVDVIHLDDGNYSIIDYKSGVSSPSTLRFELNFYAKLVNDSKILDKPISHIGAYGYKTGELFYEDIGTKSYNTMLKKVEQFKSIKFDEIIYNKNPTYACNWCQYILSCGKEKSEQVTFTQPLNTIDE